MMEPETTSMRPRQNLKRLTLKTTLVLSMAICAPLVFAADTAASPFKWHCEGEAAQLDLTHFTEGQRKQYEVFGAKCGRCHTLKRPIHAVETGLSPISNKPFERKHIKKYVVKMMRKPNSQIEKAEAREIILFLQSLSDMLKDRT